ncbi:MAG: bifunctional glutamate N-acetyltransferase/amino-acid acetyltransferase ArgJ [Pseudanabaenaceae cyanobacterium]
MPWQVITGGVTAPLGFVAGGITAGLKPSGAPDLALIYSAVPAVAGGVFTTSCVRAACVDFCQERIKNAVPVQAILCNAGQANACTGAEGWRNAIECAELTKQALHIDTEVLVASTGIIGRQLRMDLIRPAIPKLARSLSKEGGELAARAIITTDLVTKTIAIAQEIEGKTVRMGGIAKGSGMIHPNMATMLAFVTCDAQVSAPLWQELVRRANLLSFNQITVDGDTSTNDMLLALANGQAGNEAITDVESSAAQQLGAMLNHVCIELAKKVARDGEGATCLLEVTVTGTDTDAQARQIARTVASSSLFKSAVFGRDPNWGRIAAACGRSGVYFDQNQLHIQLGDFVMMTQGTPQEFDRPSASAYLKSEFVQVFVQVGQGKGTGTAWGCDLSYDYVKINAEYTT